MPSSSYDMFPPDHYEAIGRLIVQCSRIDTLLTALISIFADTKLFPTIAMVNHQSFSYKHDTLLAFIRFGDKGEKNQNAPLIELIGRAKQVYDYRGTIVHGLWGLGEQGNPKTVRTFARGNFTISETPAPTEEIRKRSDEAREVADQFEAIALRHRPTSSAPPTHPPKEDKG